MNGILLKRFLHRPLSVASVVPSSQTLIRRVASKMDLSQPRVIVEFGPGEGCHTRELIRRMHPASRLLLVELDLQLARYLQQQFRDDYRLTVIHGDARNVLEQLAGCGHTHCDYVLSGIPLRGLELSKKRELLARTFQALAPHAAAALIAYQVTDELVRHCQHFPRMEFEYCLRNFPPLFVMKFFKTTAERVTKRASANADEYAVSARDRR